MKKLLFSLLVAAVIGCNNDPRAKLPHTGNFGAAVLDDSAITVNDVLTAMKTTNEMPVKVTGVIAEYCKGEGCWLSLENHGGEPLFVEVEDKAFVLPHDISGKVAVVEGRAVKAQADGKKEETKVIARGILIK